MQKYVYNFCVNFSLHISSVKLIAYIYIAVDEGLYGVRKKIKYQNLKTK